MANTLDHEIANFAYLDSFRALPACGQGALDLASGRTLLAPKFGDMKVGTDLELTWK